MGVFSRLNYISLTRNIPVSVTFELTRRCILRCRHCYLAETHNIKKVKLEDELKTEEIVRILKEFKKAGTIFVNFTGGEPVLREDIVEIILKALKLNFYVKLFSSLYPVTKNLLEKLYKAGLNEIDVSLYGNKKTHNFITQTDSFEKTVANILEAKRLGFKINIKTPLMDLNYKDVNWLWEFCVKNRFNFKVDPFISPLNNGSKITEKYQLNFKRFNIKWEFLKNFSNSGDEISSFNYFACGAGRNVAGVDCYGNLYPCIVLNIKGGNLKKRSLDEIWKSEKMEKIRKMLMKEPLKCIKCVKKDWCSRCPGIAYLYGGVYKVYNQACEFAEVSKKIFENS